MRVARLAALVMAILTSACSGSLMKLPSGPGVPAADAAAALAAATAACRKVSSITAEIGVTGAVAGRRMRARLLAGLSQPANVLLEAPAPFGQPVFIFAARDADATLLLPRARRVLEHGPADAVLEAVTGVSLTPSELRSTLTGCLLVNPASEGMNVGNGWIVFSGQPRVYLRQQRPADPWRLVATVQQDSAGHEWRAEYADFAGDLPRSIRLRSADEKRFNLRLSLAQVELNVDLEDEAFQIRIPAGTDPITIEELRSAGPLAESRSGSSGSEP